MPSVLQLVRECKEVLKGGLLMKQYYQFMLHEVLDHPEKTDCNIDAFEEDLHKMLMVRAGPGGAREMSDWCVSSPGSSELSACAPVIPSCSTCLLSSSSFHSRFTSEC